MIKKIEEFVDLAMIILCIIALVVAVVIAIKYSIKTAVFVVILEGISLSALDTIITYSGKYN